MSLEAFAAKVLIVSTGTGLATRRLRTFFGVDDECQADDNSALIWAAQVARFDTTPTLNHNPYDWQPEGGGSLISRDLPSFSLLAQLEERTTMFWLGWFSGAMVAVACGVAFHRYLHRAASDRYELVVEGSRCTLHDTYKSRPDKLPALGFWRRRAQLGDSLREAELASAIVFAEQHLHAAMRRTGAYSACLVVDA